MRLARTCGSGASAPAEVASIATTVSAKSLDMAAPPSNSPIDCGLDARLTSGRKLQAQDFLVVANVGPAAGHRGRGERAAAYFRARQLAIALPIGVGQDQVAGVVEDQQAAVAGANHSRMIVPDLVLGPQLFAR